MPRVVLASRNEHKIVEMRRILKAAGADIDLIGLDDLDVAVPDVAETGATFAENALIKAAAVVDVTGMPALADDSGLTVDALNGMPGILSARWSGDHGDDAANLRLLLQQLSDTPAERRGAAFVCAIALAADGISPVVVEGTVRGHLTAEPIGENGFGYDPIFVPDGFDVTTAQLSAVEKDKVSHRGRALRALVEAGLPI